MEAQNFIESAVHLSAYLIVFYLVCKYSSFYGVVISSLLLFYSIFSFVFHLGILGVPIASQLFELMLNTQVNEAGKTVPTLWASVIGIISGASKVAIAIATLLITKRLITNLGIRRAKNAREC